MTVERRILRQPYPPSKVVIDWTEQPEDRDALLSWVKSYPRRGDIHVYLPSRREQPARRFQRALQALGCTVTRKNGFANAS